MTTTPKPGSIEAARLGCTCPRWDNCHGEGVVIDGERVWWRNINCPVHVMREGDDDDE